MAVRKFKCKFSHTVIRNYFSLKTNTAMISKTSKLLEIYGLDNLEPLHFPKMSYPDNLEVVSSYSLFSNLWKELAFSRA